MKTVVVYDVAGDAMRRRLRATLRHHGFVHLFGNVAVAQSTPNTRAQLLRDIRRRLAGHPHRILLLPITARQFAEARWIVGGLT